MTTRVALRPDDLVPSVPDLGSPPLVYRRLVEVLDDPRAGVAAAAEVIQQDPALTARILRIVNSAFFSFPSRIDSVPAAVNVLGTSQVRYLALATSVTALFRDLPPDLINAEDFWKHSLACGVAARVIAEAGGHSDIERFFVAGMLHDIGRLILFLGAPDEARAVAGLARQHGVLLYEAEQDLVGFDHALIGGAVMSGWNMSDALTESVRYHHEPTRAPNHALEAAVVHVADVLTNALALGSSGEQLVPPLSAQAWDALDVAPDAIPSLVSSIEVQYADSVSLFETGP